MTNIEQTIFIKKKVSDLSKGDILLHSVYRSDGLMLIRQYKSLSKDLAAKIKSQIIGTLPVLVLSSNYDLKTFNENQYFKDKELIQELKDITKEYNQYMRLPFEENYFIDNRAINEIDTTSMDPIAYNEDLYISALYKSSFFSNFERLLESSHLQARGRVIKENLLDMIQNNTLLMDELNKIKDYKDILLLHSINTTSLSLMIGLTLELDDSSLMDLALTNLFIDLSITQIPKDKFEFHLKQKSSVKDFYQLHLDELTKLCEKIDLLRKESIIYGVLDHYEHYNGGGYPKGKKGPSISLYGRIIHIAHAYDEMVGGYFYNSGIKPMLALKNIWQNSGSRFDQNIIRTFIDRTIYFKIGQNIILDGTHQGKIIGFTDFASFPLSPIIEMNNGNVLDTLKA